MSATASEQPAEDRTPPQTGVPQIDDVTAGLVELADLPVTEHLDRLTRAQTALHDALHDEQASSTSPTARDRDQPPRP